jgi:hypothetical protein
MIALQPDFEQVVKAAVRGDVLRRQVAMVIQNRLVRGESVIQRRAVLLCSRKSSVMKDTMRLRFSSAWE